MAQSNKKQPGPNALPNKLYKFLVNNLVFIKIYASLFNIYLSQGQIPDKWRVSHISLIYKENDATDSNNYRLIALLNTDYKTFTYILSANDLENS